MGDVGPILKQYIFMCTSAGAKFLEWLVTFMLVVYAHQSWVLCIWLVPFMTIISSSQENHK
jgi:hypothetical protein